MNWNILTPYEKVIIVNLLPNVRINYKHIEPRYLYIPNKGNYSLHSYLFGDSDDLMYNLGSVGRCKSRVLKGIHAWESITQFYEELLTIDFEYTSIQKRLVAVWTIEAISKFYYELAKLYYFQENYKNKVELINIVQLILDHIHNELAKFEVDPNSKSMLCYMDITRIYYSNNNTTVADYDAILDICEQYATDWFNIYPFAPRPDHLTSA
jgi:hypothetical protein